MTALIELIANLLHGGSTPLAVIVVVAFALSVLGPIEMHVKIGGRDYRRGRLME